jgi:hypothetical protein
MFDLLGDRQRRMGANAGDVLFGTEGQVDQFAAAS